MGTTGMACADSQFCFVGKAVCGEAGGLWPGRPAWPWRVGVAARCPQGAPVCCERFPAWFTELCLPPGELRLVLEVCGFQ